MSALQQYNLGTVVVWDFIPTGMRDAFMLNYVFWAFKPSIDGFQHCGPVIYIDRTHLNGKYTSTILIAIGITANNKILPIAFTIVDEQRSASWTWFLKNLRQHIVCGQEGVTLISNLGEGILSAISTMWTNPRHGVHGYHRFCLRHVCANFYKEFRNTTLRDLVWRAGTLTSAEVEL
ncbi:hypothetical protein L1049_022600 [Liquidambar formosana]|uniref:MULE transposase domain-containing protein n=1 Tax=Liquidambar formosana TaxID=63359 RepID=A0AAP0RC96_LIQFO